MYDVAVMLHDFVFAISFCRIAVFLPTVEMMQIYSYVYLGA